MMTMKKYFPILLGFLFFTYGEAFAAKRYYIMGVAGTWNTTLSWSTTSGGASGASIPGSTDTAYFDANGTGACVLDAAVNIKRLDISSGYTGIITHGVFTVTVGTGGAVLSGGTFSGGSANITLSGACTISGCAFTSTSGTFSTNSNFTYSSGSFTHNSGIVKFTATSTIAGSFTTYNLKFSPTGNSAYTVSNTLTVDNNLYFEGSSILTLNTGTVDVKKDVYASNTGSATTGGTGTVKFSGTTRQTLYGHNGFTGPIPNVTINKSDTLALQDTICIGGSFTRTAGVVSAGTSNVTFKDGNGSTITGNTTLYDVTFLTWTNNSSYTIASGNTLTVERRLLYSGDQYLSINTGTIAVKADMKNSNLYAGGGGTGTLLFNGTGTQTLTGSSTAGVGALCDVVINKSSSDTLKLALKIYVRGDWTRTAGVVFAGTSLVRFTETKTITGTQELYDVDFTCTASAIMTIASGNTLTVNHALTTLTSLAMSFNGTIHAKGDITINNTGAGTGTGTFVINGNGNQTLDGPAGDNQGRLPNVQINKTQGTLTLVDHISIYGNWTHTAGVLNEGTSTVFFVNTKTITGLSGTGLDTLYNVIFSGANAYTYTIASGTTLTVSNTLSFDGSAAITLNTGTIHAQGNVTTTNSSTSTTGTATLVINGTGSQTLTGSGTAGAGKLPHITVDKTSGTLTLASIISCTGNWIYVKGTVSPGESSVVLYGTFNLDGQQEGGSSTMSFFKLQVSTGTRTLMGSIDVNDNFAISSGATCVAGTHTVTVGGNWNSQGTWTYNTSTVVFDGTTHNSIRGASGTVVQFASVVVNRNIDRASGLKSVTLLNPVKINTAMTITEGRIKTTRTNYLSFADGATCSAGNDTAYVHGPVIKIGNEAFTFPLGDTTYADTASYHPLGITAPTSATDEFEAEYKKVEQTVGDSLVDTLYSVSSCDHWLLDRNVGSSNVKVTVGWHENCPPDELAESTIAMWDGNKWIDAGAASRTVNWPMGTITAEFNATFVSNQAFIVIGVTKPLYRAYAVLKKKLDGNYYRAFDAIWFKFDDEYNDAGNVLTFTLRDAATNDVVTLLGTANNTQAPVFGDNRFKLDLYDTSGSPLPSGYYILEVTNEKNEKWYLRFKNQ